jgi:hypothetical protein
VHSPSACFINPRTRRNDVEQLVDDVLEIGRELSAPLGHEAIEEAQDGTSSFQVAGDHVRQVR